jgi:diaminopimelate decarboxylase
MITAITELVSCFQRTPVLVYRESALVKNVESIRRSLSFSMGDRYDLFFALKACYARPVLQCLAKLGVGVETMTEMEWRIASAAGFPTSSTICNGVGRSNDLLNEASRCGAHIIIDSEGELLRLEALAAQHRIPVRLGVRLRPALDAFPGNPYASRQHKLGISADSEVFWRMIDRIASKPFLCFETLHTHCAINETAPDVFIHVMRQLASVRQEIEQRYPTVRIGRIDLGGGWATNKTAEPTLLPMVVAIGQAFAAGFPKCRLMLEPGRFIVSDSGVVVTSVTEIKENAGRNFVFVDAGTNVLIPLPTAAYRLIWPEPTSEGLTCDIVDGITSPANVIARDVHVQTLPRVGDRWILGDCGAYTSAMNEFWGFEPYPIWWLEGSGRLVEVLSLEQIAVARRALLDV